LFFKLATARHRQIDAIELSANRDSSLNFLIEKGTESGVGHQELAIFFRHAVNSISLHHKKRH
jgi:hypothetical protein